jgi:hypothetical protein
MTSDSCNFFKFLALLCFELYAFENPRSDWTYGHRGEGKTSPTEAEFLDKIQTKESFSLCYSRSPLQLCLEISIYSNTRNLLQFL